MGGIWEDTKCPRMSSRVLSILRVLSKFHAFTSVTSSHVRACPRQKMFWVLQVAGSNPAAPTSKIKDLSWISGAKSSQEIELGRPWEDKKPPSVPSVSYQTDSLLKPTSALGLDGTCDGNTVVDAGARRVRGLRALRWTFAHGGH